MSDDLHENERALMHNLMDTAIALRDSKEAATWNAIVNAEGTETNQELRKRLRAAR